MSKKNAALCLLVGLGNPDKKYLPTRHNVGFWFIDTLSRQHAITLQTLQRFHSVAGKGDIASHTLWLQKPLTYMNHSGRAVATLMNYYKIPPTRVLVAHDDLDLPAGTVKLKTGGGHGGHNGLRDIIACTGSRDFMRLRIGIGHPGHKNQVLGWVLNKPDKQDQEAIEAAIGRAAQVTPLLVTGDVSGAMTTLHGQNTRRCPDTP